MSSSTGNGAASESSIFCAGPSPATFDGAAVTAFWQSNATRWMRSSQILMRGMAEVVRLEGELGRNLLQAAIGSVKTPSFDGKPEERAREQLGIAAKEFSGLIAGLRKIADEAMNLYNDAALALFEVGSPAATLSAATLSEPVVPHAAEPMTKGRQAPIATALARAAE